MALTIKIVSEHRDLVGDDYERVFHEQGGTIGRGLQNDWILPDPDRYISGRHATIDYRGGMYYLADTSSNGVYMNGESEPIGKGNPRRLFDGDRIRMGDFEFAISIDQGESIVMPLDEPDTSVAPDNIEQFVDEDMIESGMQLLDEDELTGDGEFQSVLFGDAPAPKAAAAEKPANEDASATPAKDDAMATELFESFLNGLGISSVELHPTIDRSSMLLAAGVVLREFVEGTIHLLTSRANLKNSFRLDQTTLLPRHNNPLKFSDNTNDLVKQLLVGEEGEYLNARDAVREACRDLVNHQDALIDAMNAAFVEFADRFDPDELEEGFERTLGSGKMLGFRNKSKYWALYRDLYPIMTEKGGGRFPQMFGEEFVKAYERQVAEYRRHDREGTAPRASSGTTDKPTESELMATQKLERPEPAPPEVFDDADFVDTIANESGDPSFMEELENSINEELRSDQLRS